MRFVLLLLDIFSVASWEFLVPGHIHLLSKREISYSIYKMQFFPWLVPDACLRLGLPRLNLRFSIALTILSYETVSLFHHSMLI